MMNITPVLRPAPQPFPIDAVTPASLTVKAELKPLAPKVPSNSVTPLEFGFKYAAPCGILTVYTLNHGERHAISDMLDWITLHIKKAKCLPCDRAYYGTDDGPELQDPLPIED